MVFRVSAWVSKFCWEFIQHLHSSWDVFWRGIPKNACVGLVEKKLHQTYFLIYIYNIIYTHFYGDQIQALHLERYPQYITWSPSFWKVKWHARICQEPSVSIQRYTLALFFKHDSSCCAVVWLPSLSCFWYFGRPTCQGFASHEAGKGDIFFGVPVFSFEGLQNIDFFRYIYIYVCIYICVHIFIYQDHYLKLRPYLVKTKVAHGRSNHFAASQVGEWDSKTSTLLIYVTVSYFVCMIYIHDILFLYMWTICLTLRIAA